MYKRVKLKKLGRKKKHRESLIQNQMRTLFTNGILKTTTSKAKATKAVAQSFLSRIDDKELSLTTRRDLKRILGSKELIEKAIKYVENKKYGVRIIKTGFRSGDNAQLSRLELIGFEGKQKRKVHKREEEEKETKKADSSRKTNKDIEGREPKKSTRGSTTKAERKSTQRVRTRAGL